MSIEPMTPQAEAEARAITWHLAEAEEHGTGHGSGAATLLGFWIYLMTDALLFAAIFAVFGVAATAYAGGPMPREIFDLPLVAVNTALLLVSSITYGFAMLEMSAGRVRGVQLWLGITFALGAAFVGVELYEFATLIEEGATPQRSAFLSAFFTLVATHGLHVTVGLIWIATMLVQVGSYGLIEANRRRLLCLSLFWHFLDIIWIGVFTFVYLLGVLR